MPGSVPGVFVMYFIHAALHFLFARRVLGSIFFHIEHEDDHDTGIRMALHIVKEHGGTVHCGGTSDGSASADIAVDAGEFRLRVDLRNTSS